MTEVAAKGSELKAEAFTSKQYDRWMNGEIGRRILPVPFWGPIPDPKGLVKGYDLDAEFFDGTTDLFGPFPGLRASRWREIDWHHDDSGVPSKRVGGPASMKGVLIGEMEMDADPEEDGLWADWWIKRGQARRDLVARRVAEIERRGEPLYNSTQAVFKRKADNGHIDVWPLYRNTVTTAPQNTLAVIPPLKGLLDEITTSDLSSEALSALLVGLDALRTDLAETSAGQDPDTGDPLAKAGRVLSTSNEREIRSRLVGLREAIDAFEQYVDSVVGDKEKAP